MATSNNTSTTTVDWNDPKFNLLFDSPNADFYSPFSPSPGQVLEALTMSRANDGYEMERMETIGDSLLKLAISIHSYGNLHASNFSEGDLTLLRSKQICNHNLYRLGLKLNLEKLLVAHSFDINNNFLPPLFQSPVSADGVDRYLHQDSISNKNIADCVESLIGVYLITLGVKGLSFDSFNP